VEKYCGKYITISGTKIIAADDNRDVAYNETIKTIPPGSFMIKRIMEEEEYGWDGAVLDVDPPIKNDSGKIYYCEELLSYFNKN
jgi:hypothetical protein